MITLEYLTQCINNILESIEKDKEKAKKELPNPFVIRLTENDKNIYNSKKQFIIEGDYSQASLLINVLVSADTKLIILNELFIEFCKIGDMIAFNFIIDQVQFFGRIWSQRHSCILLTLCVRLAHEHP